MIFVDSCILIDYSKGKIAIEDKSNLCISSIVEMEFKVGALNKREKIKIDKIVSEFVLIETNQDILDLSTKLIDKYSLSHNMAIYDSIIASTCLIYDLILWTHNKKDFKFINGLILKE